MEELRTEKTRKELVEVSFEKSGGGVSDGPRIHKFSLGKSVVVFSFVVLILVGALSSKAW